MKIENKNSILTVTDFDEIEAYIVACKIEQDGIDFYKKLLEKSRDPKVKGALDFLLKEEEKHLKLFANAFHAIKEQADSDYDEDDLLTSKDYGIFHPFADYNDSEKIVNNTKKAFSLGILIEHNSIEYYTICKKNVSGLKVKKEIENIIEEEKRHKLLFKKLLQNIICKNKNM